MEQSTNYDVIKYLKPRLVIKFSVFSAFLSSRVYSLIFNEYNDFVGIHLKNMNENLDCIY